jgi:TonB family protein
MRDRRVVKRLRLGSFLLAVLVANALFAAPADARPQASGASTAQSTTDAPWPPVGVLRIGPGITAPRLIKSAAPVYPAEAVRAKIGGRVLLEMAVQADGTVGEVRVQRSLDRKFGLDDAAVKAVKEMRFTPAMKEGMAVPVLTQIEMSFAAK